MHQIILLTALTATSGLFGGARAPSCASGSCGTAFATPAPTCAPGTACGGYVQAAPAPQPNYFYYQAPAAQPQAVPQAPIVPPQAMAPQGYYYPTTASYPASPCAGGTCYRR